MKENKNITFYEIWIDKYFEQNIKLYHITSNKNIKVFDKHNLLKL